MKKLLAILVPGLSLVLLNSCDESEKSKRQQLQKKIDALVPKDLVLGCVWLDQTTVENNRAKRFSRNQIENPKAMDGYIHYNFKERSLVSNLSRMSRYGKIYDGKNLSKKITLRTTTDSQKISFYITFGIITDLFPEVPLNQVAFSIDKYTNRMTTYAYKVGKPKGDRQIINYNCNQIEKPKY